MDTMKRLTKAYESAFCMPFNSKSKFIFFSDVHRGDNSFSDEFAHNQNTYLHALGYYFREGFTYIEVGDGDELWEHSDFKHVRSAHDDVYLMLREFHDLNRFYPLYGNHNMEFKDPAYVKSSLDSYYDEYLEETNTLFSEIVFHEAIRLQHEDHQKEIFVVHGHQGDFINDQAWKFTKFVNRHLWHYFHVVGFTNPASPSKNLQKRHKIEKNYTKWIREHQKMLIVGHTHRPKFPRTGEEPYFNTGACVFPRNITGIEIEDDSISLIDWRLRPDEEGRLCIIRKIVKGPEPLSEHLR
jgi:UDP-2,3-diacylglucosamine pyrophosphatase LpxH